VEEKIWYREPFSIYNTTLLNPLKPTVAIWVQLYCTHMATVGFKGLITYLFTLQKRSRPPSSAIHRSLSSSFYISFFMCVVSQ